MSADNGVYILKTKDQYRVIHAQAIENLYWSHLQGGRMMRELVSTRIVEYYAHTRYTRDFEKAMKVANAIARGCYILEYGIKTFYVNKTWRQIVSEAKGIAPIEIETLKNRKGSWKYDIEELEKIIAL